MGGQKPLGRQAFLIRFYLEVRSTSAADASLPTFSPLENKTMNAIEVVRRYNQTWNGRDAEAIGRLCCGRGTGGPAVIPTRAKGLPGKPLAPLPKGVWAALPDMTVELVSSVKRGRAKSPISGCCVAATADR
jgi:hypothetical protein